MTTLNQSVILFLTALVLTAAPIDAGTPTTTSLLDEETDIVNTGGTLVSAANFGANGDPGQSTSAVTVNGLFHGLGAAADMSDLDDSITVDRDENPEDVDHIAVTFPLNGGLEEATEHFFRIEEG
jgi:hypothetical protein